VSSDPYWEKVAEKRDAERDKRLKNDVDKSKWLNLSIKKTRGKVSGLNRVRHK